MDNMPLDSVIISRIIFLMNLAFTFHDLRRIGTSVCGARKAKREKPELPNEKWTAWRVLYGSGIVDTYYFSSRAVSGVDYYQMLDTYVWSEAQQLTQNVAFQEDGALPYVTVAVYFLFGLMVPNLWVGRYGLTGWPSRPTDLSAQKCLFVDLCLVHCNGLLGLT